MSPTDFMAGTAYMGEWESKVTSLVQAIRRPRRILLYVPNLSDLSAVGRWAKSDSNVAAALAPYVEDGSIVVLGESTPEEYHRGLGRVPALQRLFEPILVQEPTPAQTRVILEELARRAGCPLSEERVQQLMDLGAQFMSHMARPGSVVALLRSVLAERKGRGEPLAEREVLEVLARSTGLPSRLMDDASPLQLDEVRAFFEQRILGQPEAVEAMVNLVALIKAGLTDPNKPFGVFLFIGPTGVGKTELARALAEFLFGDAARLKRFDMSEYAIVQGFERLIGNQFENGQLTDAVRQQPFSVVLLDEIEKSHVNVFDLCLQLFDAGRLTDGRGRTVDFRRTILILTSNIGATGPVSAVGFQNATSSPPADPDREGVLRELNRFFRPEFLNRLDRILYFRPLSLEVAERIARRELDLVLHRSGMRRRHLVAEVDPAVISKLVQDGYSPHFGARPLKRTVEQLCLMPMARFIASGRIPPRSVLHLGLRDGRIEVRVSRPTIPEAGEAAVPREGAVSLLEAALSLGVRLESLAPSLQPLTQRKSDLLQQTLQAGFQKDALRRRQTFDEIHKLEQLLSFLGYLQVAVPNLVQRLSRPALRPADEHALGQRLEELTEQLGQLEFVAGCQDATDLSDTLLVLTLVDRQGDPLRGVEALARMYLGWTGRRRLTGRLLAERFEDTSEAVYLQINGLGAYALLKRENGLHRLERHSRRRQSRSGREKHLREQELVRVRVLPVGSDPDKEFLRHLKRSVHPLKQVRARLLSKASWEVVLFHEPSLRSLEVWLDGSRTEALTLAQEILHMEITAPQGEQSFDESGLVRQYRFGQGPRVKDVQSGRSSPQVDRVLQGRLDLVL